MRLGKRVLLLSMAAVLAIGAAGCGGKKDDVITITNVSYDPTRELYERYNDMFEQYYKEQYGQDIKVIQSHGGSGSQARSVVEGCNADVVTLALEHDIDLISANGLIDSGWIDEFDKDSAPYTSTIVFLVRKGNAKDIKDWNDLVKDDVEVITPRRLQHMALHKLLITHARAAGYNLGEQHIAQIAVMTGSAGGEAQTPPQHDAEQRAMVGRRGQTVLHHDITC